MNRKYDDSLLTKAFFGMMPVAILMMIIPSLNSIVDGVIASNFLGEQAMTSIGLFNPVSLFLQAINLTMIGGAIILVGRSIGSGDKALINQYFTTDLVVNSLTCFLVAILCFVFAEPLAILLGADGSYIPATVAYIRGIAFGFPAITGITHLGQFLELEQKHKITTFSILLMVVFNATSDILAVVIFDLGLFGLGLATAVSNWLIFLLLFTPYLLHQGQFTFAFKHVNLSLLRETVTIGLPGAILQLFVGLRSLAMNYILLKYSGAIGVAALSAQSAFGAFEYGIDYGIATSSRNLFSIFYGSGDRKSMTETMKVAMTRGLAFSVVFCLVCSALAVPFTQIFFHDEASEVYKLTVAIFRIFPFCMPLAAIGNTFSNYYQACSRMKITNFLSLVDGFIGMTLFSFVLAPFLGAYGVWIAFVANGALECLIILVFTIVRIGHFPISFDDLMSYPDSFGTPEGDRLDITLHSMDEVIGTSEQIVQFCQDHAIDGKRSYYCGLALEEMAGNVVSHGFVPGRKSLVTIGLAYKDNGNELVLRITDNCPSFDPTHFQSVMFPSDPTANIGIRMISKIAKSMEYSPAVGLNVLTIVL